MRKPRIAIFASGTGSNAESLIVKMKALGGKIEFVLSDRSDAGVLEKAMRQGVTTYLVEKTAERIDHENEILKLVDRHKIDWVLLAGYMRLISGHLLEELSLRHQGQTQIVNVHPSLLPQYPGAKALERAFADQVSESGVTLHLVDEGMDTGLVLSQQKLTLHQFEAFSDFKMRMHALEHAMYGELLENIVLGKIPTQTYKESAPC
ncbi:MAG TPA: formyltransferase family protein [Bdellovibrio sp.]|uniref:formyltransferase family protein n=1 Tax=Bdellovibrio sp. TaxID=28201 RepID=UPI002EFF6548